MENHMRTTHTYCALCAEHFIDTDSLAVHNGALHRNVVFHCSVCAQPYLKRSQLLQHYGEMHSKGACSLASDDPLAASLAVR